MLFVSYIDFKMIMFRYVLSLLIHFLHSGESSDFLYLLKTKNSDYCLTNSSSAMYFTDNNDKVLEDEEKNPTTFTHPDAFWQVVSSLHNDMLPVFDQRWTNLRTEMITRKDFERAHMLLYPKISKTISNDEKITFSIRANEFEFYLCDSGNIASSFCYWFQMGLEGRVLLRKCDHVISVIEHMRGCECKKPVKTGYLHLSDKNWTHVELEMKKNTFFLKDIDILHEKNILKYRDPRKYETYYFLIHTEENEAFYKLHEYEYHRTNTSRFIEIKDAWKVNNGKVCFSLFYTTCKHCELKIKLIHIKEKEEKEERKTEEISPTETLPPSFGIWRQEILRMSPYANNTPNYTYILLEANLTHQNVQNPFWAIDSFEKCPESEYHKSTERTELKSCQLVSNGDKVEWTQTGEQEECQCTNNMKKRLGIKDDILKLCERTNGRQRCCQINVNDEKPGSVFDNFKVEWNRNNTIILIWKCRRFNGCSMKNIEILIDYNADHRNTTSIPIEEHTCGEIFHNKIDTIFPWSVQLDIEITAYIDDRKHSINATEYSFPEIPELVNSTITILDEQNDTIRIQINITEKTHQNPNTYKYMFILIADPQESNSDNNFIELKKVLNQNMKQACCFQVIAEIDLSNANQQLFNYTIGDGSVNRSNVLNETIHNNALKRRPSEIIIILTNEYKKKYSSKLYSRLVQKMKVFELTPNSRSDGEEDDKDIYVILFTLLAVCVIGMIIIIFIIYKRKIDRGHSDVQFMTMDEVWQHKLDEDEPNFMDLPSDRKREDAKLPNGLQEARKFPEQSDIIQSKLIEVSEFSEYMKRSLKYRELERQHELFPRGQTQACEYGSLEANKHKNRYETLITYDHSRVVLAKIADDEYSDYINASYIDGYKIANAYIATQGPKKETTRDFWRMIWQENVNFIVMIGNIFGNGKEEIHQYWPKEGETTFGNIVVQIQSVTEFAEFEKRIFYLTHEYETRKLEQIHFTAWPDRGLPLYPHTLLSFVEKMVKIPLASSSPVVVHCSAGIGRTGTILLIDICIRMAVEEESVDFLHTLQKLRQQRPNMVDNAEQYKLAHLVVLDYIHGLRTSIPCDQLDEQLEKLAYNSDELKIQFEFLENCRWIDEAMENVVEIAANYIIPPEKNRFGHIVPERRSVELPIYPGEDSSSFYINAVRVPGIKCPEKYIVTQQPMPNTLGDFWRLIIRMGSEIIISLNEINLDDETCCMFWPTAEDPRIHLEDSIVLRFNERIRFTQYDIYSLEVSDNRVIEMEVKVIALKGWKPQADIPFNGDDFFSFWQDADSLSRNSENIIVTCFDGVTASGVFVALSSVIERMRIEKQCDVGKAVRLVRQNRKQFVRKHVGKLRLLNENIRMKVNTIPVVAGLHNGTGVGNMLESLHVEMKKMKFGKFHQFNVAGLEMDDYVECLDSLFEFRERYEDNYYL